MPRQVSATVVSVTGWGNIGKRSKGTGIILFVALVAIALSVWFIPVPSLTQHARNPSRAISGVRESYETSPISFEANQGQADSSVKFLSRGLGYTLFLTRSEAVLSLSAGQAREEGADLEQTASRSVVRMKLVGGNPNALVQGTDELLGKTNYYIGNDPKQWHTAIPNYARVRYRNVYPGVDLVYYGNHKRLEHDFVVAPGVNPRAIRISLEGPSKVSISTGGELVLDTGVGQLRFQKPDIYQNTRDGRHKIAGSYRLNDDAQVGFEVAAYDPAQPLVIDPVLLYSTYLGGSYADDGNGIAVDGAGNAYVVGKTGTTTSLPADFPTTPDAFQDGYQGPYNRNWGDAFVTKFSSTGSLLYSTYFGGSGLDEGRGIAVDSSGNAYITGVTRGLGMPNDLPTTPNAFQTQMPGGFEDGFVTKLDATGGALIYSTYLGGSGDDRAERIAIDSSGNAYVLGSTDSNDFPLFNPMQSTGAFFLSKLNPDGSALVYSTYLDSGIGLAVDSPGNAYISGSKITKLNPAGDTVLYSTSLAQGATDIAVDSQGNAYVTGPGAFAGKLNSSGTALLYSTNLSGTGQAIAVDSSGNAYVAGVGDARLLLLFVTKLDTSGVVLYNTALNGSLSINPVAGGSIAVDSLGNAWTTGTTNSFDFPVTGNALQVWGNQGNSFTKRGMAYSDAFVVEIGPPNDANSLSGNNCNATYSGTFTGNLTVSPGQGCTFQNGGVDGNVILNGGSLVLSDGFVRGNIEMTDGNLIIFGNSSIGSDLFITGGTFWLRPSTTIQGHLVIYGLSPSPIFRFPDLPIGGVDEPVDLVCGVTVKGNVIIAETEHGLRFGGALCKGNTIEGEFLLTDSNAGVAVVGNKVGDVTLLDNAGAADVFVNVIERNLSILNNTGPINVLNNTVGNTLQCRNNTSISGGGNTAKQKEGQCSNF